MRGPESSDFDEGGVNPPDFSILENEQMEGDKPTRAERMAAAEAKCKEAYEEVKKQADEAGVEVEEYIERFFDEQIPDDKIKQDIIVQEIAENWEGSIFQKYMLAQAHCWPRGDISMVGPAFNFNGSTWDMIEEKALEDVKDLPCGPEGEYTMAEVAGAHFLIEKDMGLTRYNYDEGDPELLRDVIDAMIASRQNSDEVLMSCVRYSDDSTGVVKKIFEDGGEQAATLASTICDYATQKISADNQKFSGEIASSFIVRPERAGAMVCLLPLEKRMILGATLDEMCFKHGTWEGEIEYIQYRLDGGNYSGDKEDGQIEQRLSFEAITEIVKMAEKDGSRADRIICEHPQLVERFLETASSDTIQYLTPSVLDKAIPHGKEAYDLLLGIDWGGVRKDIVKALRTAPEESDQDAIKKLCLKTIIATEGENGKYYGAGKVVLHNLEELSGIAGDDKNLLSSLLGASLREGLRDEQGIKGLLGYSDEFVESLPEDDINTMALKKIRGIRGSESRKIYSELARNAMRVGEESDSDKGAREKLEEIDQYFNEEGIDVEKLIADGRLSFLFTNKKLSIWSLKYETSGITDGLSQLLEEYYSLSKSTKEKMAFKALIEKEREGGESILSLAAVSGERRKISAFLTAREAAAFKYCNLVPIEDYDNLDKDFDEEGNMRRSFELKIIGKFFRNPVEIEPCRRIVEDGEVDEENILHAIMFFAREDYQDWTSSSEGLLKMKEFMLSDKGKAMALRAARGLYLDSIRHPDADHEELSALGSSIEKFGGAGPLSQISACLIFAERLMKEGDAESKEHTSLIERRFSEDKWSDLEKASFYTISADILKDGPDIYKEFSELFSGAQLDKREFKTFVKDIYPLYKAKLLLMGDDRGTAKEDLHRLLLPFSMKDSGPDTEESAIEITKEKILDELKGLFGEKFGIRDEALPPSFSEKDIDALSQVMLYLGNLSGRDERKQAIVGLFLALQLGEGDKWKEFRSGKIQDIGGIIDGERIPGIIEAVAKSRENTPITSENTKIEGAERLAAFSEALQEDTSTISVGTIDTVDKKLQAIVSGMEELTDPDLYADNLDKAKVNILNKYKDEPEIIGRVASKLRQQSTGRNDEQFQLNEHEQEVADDLLRMLAEHGIALDTESIEDHLQKDMQAISRPFKILKSAEKYGVSDLIAELNEKIEPNPWVIDIFSKMGEEFKPSSGAIAIGEDVGYLRDLLNKNEQKLTDDERKQVEAYLDGLDDVLGKMDEVYEKVLSSYMKLKERADPTDREKSGIFAEVDRTVMGTREKRVFTTKCTGDLVTILANIRACLNARSSTGFNNDTDLSFGEPYKFFVCSKENESSKSSISDQIVHFVPVEDDGGKRMSFVMDKIYGSATKDILVAHISTVVKKAKALKEQFPEVPITVTIPISTNTAGFSPSSLEGILGEMGVEEVRNIEAVANEPKSGFSDHYIEYGPDSPRQAGPRQFSGIEIVI